jgi:hypothetical protein
MKTSQEFVATSRGLTRKDHTREVMRWGDQIDFHDTKHRMTRKGGTAAYVMRRIAQCHAFCAKPTYIGSVY